MPKVGEKEFPYTPEGAQAAVKESSQTGIPVSNAGERSQSYQLGGQVGQPGFGQRPPVVAPSVPPSPEWEQYGRGHKMNPRMEEGGKVDDKPTNDDLGILEYKKGGKARRQARRKARREARQEKRNLRKVSKLQKKGVKVKTTAKTLEDVKKLKPTGKIRAGAKEVTVTKGGAYAAYKKKSAPAKSFRKAFAAAKGKDFTWDGRKYSGKTKEQAAKAKAAKATDIKPVAKAKAKAKPKLIQKRKPVKDMTLQNFKDMHSTMKESRSKTDDKKPKPKYKILGIVRNDKDYS